EVRFQLAADSDAALAEIEQDITDFAERSDRRWHSEPEMMRGLRSLQRLNDILREWSLDASQLDRWDRALTRRSQILVAQEHEVAQIYDTWLATREAGAREAFPKVAMQKVSDVVRDADAVRGLIRNSMAKLLGLQSQLAGRREILAKIRGDIDRARGESGRNLFVLDSPPLWTALSQHGIQDVVAAQAAQSSRRFSEDLQEFFQKYAGRVALQTLFLIALLALFRRLSGRVTPDSMSRLGEAPAGLIFGRWFATCFLLALIPVPLLYPEATAAVLRITTIFTVIPLIRLLPGWLASANHRWLYLLITFYVIDFFRY